AVFGRAATAEELAAVAGAPSREEELGAALEALEKRQIVFAERTGDETSSTGAAAACWKSASSRPRGAPRRSISPSSSATSRRRASRSARSTTPCAPA